MGHANDLSLRVYGSLGGLEWRQEDPDRLYFTRLGVAPGFAGPNEPAEVRVHPSGRRVYANNRGEDSIAWFETDGAGRLQRRGHVCVAMSLHPGVAARSFAFSPDGSFMLAADRPAGLVLSLRVGGDGALTPLGSVAVGEPAFVALLDK